MSLFRRHPLTIALAGLLTGAVAGSPAIAHPGSMGGFGDGSWHGPGGFRSIRDRDPGDRGPAEGKVEVNRFIAEDIDLASLKGATVTVAKAPEGANAEDHELRIYESAVIDSLAGAGYQTATTVDAAAQVAEVRVTHTTVVPEEAPHKPVSGEMTMGVSNHGSMMGMAIAVDMTKPRKALISTRLEARIRDKASGKMLWEGRADIVTREGNPKWGDNAIAARLSRALFEDFPGHSGETRRSAG